MILGIVSEDMLLHDDKRNAIGINFWGGAGWARIGQYVNAYKAKGWDVIVGRLWKEADKGLSIARKDGERVFPDVLIMQRMMKPDLPVAMANARKRGQFIINDVDDWFWGLDKRNNAYEATREKKMRVMYGNIELLRFDNPDTVANYRKVLEASDLITVSTPYLADALSKMVSVPIEVIPNYVDLSRFRPVVQEPGVPTLGWAGSLAHRSGDLDVAKGALRTAATSGLVTLHHSGASEDPNVETFGETVGVPDDMISTQPLVPSYEYPRLLTFQAGIIPLNDIPFNHAKSDIKGLEYAACGIPFIASDTDSYRRLWEDWGGCFHLARKSQHWISGIKRYADYGNRKADAATLLDRVRDRDIAYGVMKWTELLEGVV